MGTDAAQFVYSINLAYARKFGCPLAVPLLEGPPQLRRENPE